MTAIQELIRFLKNDKVQKIFHNNTTTKLTEVTMNDKIKELLKNAEQSDAIAKNKWRIENREQLREERKQNEHNDGFFEMV